MSYAESLAKDRDKYRVQRDKLAGCLSRLIEVYGFKDQKGEAPVVKEARKALQQVYGSEPDAATLLGLKK